MRTLQGAVVEQFSSAIVENISLGGSIQLTTSQVSENGGIYSVYAEAEIEVYKLPCTARDLMIAHNALKQRGHRREESEMYNSLTSFTTSLLHAIGHEDSHATDVYRCNIDLILTDERVSIAVVAPIIISDDLHLQANSAAATCYSMLLGRSGTDDLQVPSRHLAGAFCALYMGILMEYVYISSGSPGVSVDEDADEDDSEINILEVSAVDNVPDDGDGDGDDDDDDVCHLVVDADVLSESGAYPIDEDPSAEIHQMYNPVFDENEGEEYDDDLDIEMFSDDESVVSAEGSKIISLNDFESDSGRSSSRASNSTRSSGSDGSM